jgi:hypothetical protein
MVDIFHEYSYMLTAVHDCAMLITASGNNFIKK